MTSREADSPRDLTRLQNVTAAGGVLGAIAASPCCLLPLLLFILGASGALAELMMERSMTKFTTSRAVGLLIVSSGAAMAEQRTVTLAVDKMYCEACPYLVKKAIERVSGVAKVTVSYKEK